MTFTLQSFSEEPDFWARAYNEVLSSIEQAIQTHGHARVGIAGGKTPLPLYEKLARADLPWEKITWILLDERYVPRGEEESNWTQIQAHLNGRGQIPSENWVAFDTALSLEGATLEFRKKLALLAARRQPLFDVLILGVGADGHIASLFEGDPSLLGKEYAYATEAPGYQTTTRLTVSLWALLQSGQALVLLHGAQKRPIVQALKGALHPPLIVLNSLFESIPVTILSFMEGK